MTLVIPAEQSHGFHDYDTSIPIPESRDQNPESRFQFPFPNPLSSNPVSTFQIPGEELANEN